MPAGKIARHLDPTRGKHFLFVVAIDTYQHLSGLNSAVRDAEVIVDVLCRMYQFSPEETTFLKNEEATRIRIRRELDHLRKKVQPVDSLLVIFCGHGENFGLKQGSGLAPVDAHPENHDSFLMDYELQGMLRKINVFHLAVIIDACFSGLVVRSRNDESNRYSRLGSRPSRWALTAGNDERVEDGGPFGHSPFAYSVIHTLRRQTGREISFGSLCDKVQATTELHFREMESVVPYHGPLPGHEGGSLVFRRRMDEATDWAILIHTGEPGDYRAFLELYPNSERIIPELEKLFRDKADEVRRGMSDDPDITRAMQLVNLAGTADEQDRALSDLLLLLDQLAWEEAIAENTVETYRHYLTLDDEPLHAAEARKRIRDLQAWQTAVSQDTLLAYIDYLRTLPQPLYRREAWRYIHRKLRRIANVVIPLVLVAGLAFILWPAGPPAAFAWVKVPPGSFHMGQPNPNIGCKSCSVNEQPVMARQVGAFWMTKHEISNRQYAAFLNAYGADTVRTGLFQGEPLVYPHQRLGVVQQDGRWLPAPGRDDYPAIYVTWFGADAFARFYGCRLPSEREWEYAARVGDGDRGEKPYPSPDQAVPVEEGTPNTLGIYHLTGNVWEWTADSFHRYDEPEPDADDPGQRRVLRGGAWNEDAINRRPTRRMPWNPGDRDFNIGFRIIYTR